MYQTRRKDLISTPSVDPFKSVKRNKTESPDIEAF